MVGFVLSYYSKVAFFVYNHGGYPFCYSWGYHDVVYDWPFGFYFFLIFWSIFHGLHLGLLGVGCIHLSFPGAFLRFWILSVYRLPWILPVLRWNLLLIGCHIRLFSVLFAGWGLRKFPSPFTFLAFLGSVEDPIAMFIGRHSILIHFVSSRSCSSPLLSSVAFLAILSEIRIPTSPPLLLVLFFPTHLYPLIGIWSPVFIFVSVMRAMSTFSAWSSDCRLFIFPFRPLTSIATTVISLFFLILFLFFSFPFWYDDDDDDDDYDMKDIYFSDLWNAY